MNASICSIDDDCIGFSIFSDANGECIDDNCVCGEGFDGIDDFESKLLPTHHFYF